MTPIVDLISAIVTGMKPTIAPGSGVISGGGLTVTYSSQPPSVTDWLFVGMKLKMTFGTSTVYATVTSISGTTVIATLPASKTVPPSTVSVVLNFHHGRYLEIINTFKEATHNEAVKYEQFPAICLFQPILEEHSRDGDREATMDLVIVMDSQKQWVASQRYTYTFRPILIPIYERLIDALECSGNIQIEPNSFKYTEDPYYGKDGIYGSIGNLFNDIIDAIVINGLKIKTLKDL